MSTGRTLLYFLAWLVLVFSAGAEARELTVVTETWEPYNFERNGKVIGISTEIVEATIDAAGLSIDGEGIRILPWSRAYKMALNYPHTLIYTILRTQVRESDFHWIGPLFPSDRFYLYSRRGERGKIHSLNDAKAFQIGVLRDSIHEEFFSEKGFLPSRIQPVSDQALNLKKLLAGRIDFIVDTENSLEIRSAQMGLPVSAFEPSLFLFENGYYMALGKKSDQELARRLKSGFSKVKASGVIPGIIQKYH